MSLSGPQRIESLAALPFDIASDYAAAADLDRAFEWLERALQERTPQLLHIRVLPDFESLRADPRYTELAASIGFPG